MRVRLQDLRQGPQDFDVRINPADLHLDAEGVRFREPIVGRVRFQMFGERVRVTGTLKTTAESECVRCLQPTRVDLETQVSLVFEKRTPADEEREKHPLETDWDAESSGLEFYEEELVDATESFRQLLMVELPGYPLCRGGCRGLCPHCGADLNKGPCDCGTKAAPEADEPEWKAKLKNIRLD